MKSILLFSLVFLTSVSAYAGGNENKEFLNTTIKNFKEECRDKKGMDYLNCWSEYSPQRCKSLVYEKDKSAWSRCVYSCGSAGFFSKTFGECSK